MITQIEITRPGYKDFILSELTGNNIFLFSSSSLKNKVTPTIEQIWLSPDNDDDSVLYATTNPEEKPELDDTGMNLDYGQTTIRHLKGGQKFIFTEETAFVYAARDWYDIWFIMEINGEIHCYALCEFVGAANDWKEGFDMIYSNLLEGCYGDYGTAKNTNGGKHYAGIS